MRLISSSAWWVAPSTPTETPQVPVIGIFPSSASPAATLIMFCPAPLVAVPCLPAWFSMNETPLPFTASAMITEGFPRACGPPGP